jgi:FKBP-type peptidyl-prolyl cis-trans isomerase
MPMKPALLFFSVLLFALSAAAAPVKPQPPADLDAPPESAERHPSGLITLKLADGSGSVSPAEHQILSMRYTVWRSDGTFVVHVAEPRTVMLPLRNMLPGWREAAMMMVAGEKRRAWVPESLGGGKIPKGQMFVIDTELVEIVDPPVAPPDVAAAPDDATRTRSGLAYRTLREGNGADRPSKRSTVLVHYTGWTADGAMFDSTILQGEPAEFGLDGVIPGWTEGLQLMSVGEKTRFWVPAKLAYGSDRTKPQGMLVFDIELLAIVKK